MYLLVYLAEVIDFFHIYHKRELVRCIYLITLRLTHEVGFIYFVTSNYYFSKYFNVEFLK